MRNLILGIDIGTSGLKTGVFSPDEGLIASIAAEYTVSYPHPGWAEQDPDMWWEALIRCLQRLWAETDVLPEEIRAIGACGQSWSCIPIDRQGRVLHPTPIWIDTRAEAICRAAEESVGADRIFRTGQNPFMPGYTTPKILWFKQEQPAVYRDTWQLLQSNSFIVYRLTGVVSQDRCMSYGLHVVDMRTGQYDPELADLLGIDLDKLPAENVPCDTIVGTVCAQAAARTGLKEGTPVVAGGLDAACGTLGAGAYLEGQTQEQGGQAGGMSICTTSWQGDPKLIMSCHVVPDLWLLQGGTAGGGASLNWILQETGAPEIAWGRETGRSPFEQVSEMAGQIPAGADGLIFLPYLSGERSPLWDPQAKGVFFGLGFDKTRAHLYRAVMEGTAFALRHNLEVAEAAGTPVGEMFAMGGSANSIVWTQIKSDVTGKVIRVPATDTATILGASMLAGKACGLYATYAEAVERNVHIQRIHTPDPAMHTIYGKYYGIYRALYEQTREIMHQL